MLSQSCLACATISLGSGQTLSLPTNVKWVDGFGKHKSSVFDNSVLGKVMPGLRPYFLILDEEPWMSSKRMHTLHKGISFNYYRSAIVYTLV